MWSEGLDSCKLHFEGVNARDVEYHMHKVHQEITLSRFWEMEVGEIMDVQGS